MILTVHHGNTVSNIFADRFFLKQGRLRLMGVIQTFFRFFDQLFSLVELFILGCFQGIQHF